jgi:flagellar assembly factor FliW
VEDGHITLPVINPFLIKSDYNIEINDDDLELLQTHNEEDLIVLNVMVLPIDLKNMTMNLMAPILINIKKMVGCQVLMDHREVPLRFPVYISLMEYYKNNKEGVDEHAGIDQKD